MVSLSYNTFAVADVNNDTQLDIIVAYYGSNNVGVRFGYGNGTFSSEIVLNTGVGSHPSSIVIGDMNADTLPDIIVANHGTRTLGVMLGKGSGIFDRKNSYEESHFNFAPSVISLGDFDNDKRSEIVVVYDSSDQVDIFTTYNTGSFTDQITYSTGYKPLSVAVGDFNNDNRLDIVVANWQSNSVSVLLGYGNGSFTDQMTYSTGSLPKSVAVGDFNDDTPTGYRCC